MLDYFGYVDEDEWNGMSIGFTIANFLLVLNRNTHTDTYFFVENPIYHCTKGQLIRICVGDDSHFIAIGDVVTRLATASYSLSLGLWDPSES